MANSTFNGPVRSENGFKTIIEKSPTKKKQTKIGERIFHNETPAA